MNRSCLILERILALCLIVLMLRSAFSHLANPYYFLSSIHAYQLVSKTLAEYLAMFLPFLQITLALFLIIRWSPGVLYLVTASLFLGFIFAQVSVLIRGLEISCGCFGAADSVQVGTGTLALAIGGFIACIIGGVISWHIPTNKSIQTEAVV